ncbi:MAG: helix-turn-helix domain-containing protein, partial [Sediminibacterium sp.]
LVELLRSHIQEQGEKLNGEAKAWAEEIKTLCGSIINVGRNFVAKAGSYFQETPVVEENEILQKRITDAANWFLPRLADVRNKIEKHPIITEHKETATQINEDLHDLLSTILHAVYSIEYCRNPFSVTKFLQHKLAYAKPRINVTAYAGNKKVTNDTSGAENELLNSLKRWRNHIVEDTGLPIYLVANGKSLAEVATYLPLTKKDLVQISGFGKAKVDKYGDEIIEMVEDYCTRNGLSSNMESFITSPAKTPKKPKEEKIKEEKIKVEKVKIEKSKEEKLNTKQVSFEMYKSGKTILEIARERNFTYNTIEGHLAHYVSLGELDINDLVSEEKQKLIKEVLAKSDNQSLTDIKLQLPDTISFGEIRIVSEALRKSE